jgi:CheY-like chemotaxis protein
MQKEDDAEVTIEFAISDTGIGIEKNKLKNIFENFQQASSGTSRLYGGTGLGLAIVKQLVEAQSGNIQVKSKPDEGSTFSFTLSFKKTNATVDIETEIARWDAGAKNAKILVVEDIALNQLLMRTLLEEFGFECVIAPNGKIAVEKLQTETFDIILMDLQMPEMNGFEATEYIRNKMNFKTPIIALTADVTTSDLARCKAVGMNDYISKPVDERLLYSKIVGFLKKPSSLRGGASKTTENDGNKKTQLTNLDYIMQRSKSNEKLMAEILSLYLTQTASLIVAMKNSLRNKNWDELQAIAHKMIPSFTIVGMSAAHENMARKIQEYASTQQQVELLPDLVLQLTDILAQACEELEEARHSIKSTN